MICLKCGKDNIEQNKFCSGCGNSLLSNENSDNTKTLSFDDLKDKMEETKEEIEQQLNINNSIKENISNNEINTNVIIENNNNINEQSNNIDLNPKIELNNINNNSIDTEFYGNDFKEKSNKSLIIIIIIFILLGVLGIGFYFLNKPKNILLLSVQKYISDLGVGKDINSISSSYNLSFDMKSTDDKMKPLFDTYNNLKLSGLYEIDLNKKIANIEVGSTYKDKTLLNGSMYLENNDYYLFLEGIYNNYIKFTNKSLTNNNVSNDVDKKDINNIINGFKNATKNSIKDEYLTKNKEKITINNKEYNTNKITLIIDKTNFKTIMKDFFTYLKNDKNFVNSINNNSQENIVTKIDEILNNLDKIKEEDIPIELKMDFYIKSFTNDLLKLAIKNKISNIEVFTFDMIENNINMYIKEEDNIINFKYTNNNNNSVIEVSNQDFTMKINYNIETKYNKTIINKDVSKSVELNTLTKQEQEDITNKLFSNEGLIELKNDLSVYINSLFNSPNISENYYDNNLNNNLDINNNLDDNTKIEYNKLKELSVNDIKNKINYKENFILLISQSSCSHCISYIPKLEQLAKEKEMSIYYISVDLLSNKDRDEIDNLIDYSGTPTTIFYINGKEDLSIRISGNTDYSHILDKYNSYQNKINNIQVQ